MSEVGSYGIRRARKEYRCTYLVSHIIQIGDLYLYSAMPPWHECNADGNVWVVEYICLKCAERHGFLVGRINEELVARQAK